MDKQIIIDGVDVSGCDRLNTFLMQYGEPHEICLTSLEQWGGQEKYCKDRPNCYYKQLKRKEQEYDELAYENYELNELFDRLKAENDELKKQYNIYTCGICGNKNECNQLKSENKHLNDLLNQALKELEKTRETLTEIKEIAEDFGFNGIYEDCFTGIQKILQKISECEVE